MYISFFKFRSSLILVTIGTTCLTSPTSAATFFDQGTLIQALRSYYPNLNEKVMKKADSLAIIQSRPTIDCEEIVKHYAIIKIGTTDPEKPKKVQRAKGYTQFLNDLREQEEMMSKHTELESIQKELLSVGVQGFKIRTQLKELAKNERSKPLTAEEALTKQKLRNQRNEVNAIKETLVNRERDLIRNNFMIGRDFLEVRRIFLMKLYSELSQSILNDIATFGRKKLKFTQSPEDESRQDFTVKRKEVKACAVAIVLAESKAKDEDKKKALQTARAENERRLRELASQELPPASSPAPASVSTSDANNQKPPQPGLIRDIKGRLRVPTTVESLRIEREQQKERVKQEKERAVQAKLEEAAKLQARRRASLSPAPSDDGWYAILGPQEAEGPSPLGSPSGPFRLLTGSGPMKFGFNFGELHRALGQQGLRSQPDVFHSLGISQSQITNREDSTRPTLGGTPLRYELSTPTSSGNPLQLNRLDWDEEDEEKHGPIKTVNPLH